MPDGRLPNGVTVELAYGAQHAPSFRTMLEALGAPDVPLRPGANGLSAP